MKDTDPVKVPLTIKIAPLVTILCFFISLIIKSNINRTNGYDKNEITEASFMVFVCLFGIIGTSLLLTLYKKFFERLDDLKSTFSKYVPSVDHIGIHELRSICFMVSFGFVFVPIFSLFNMAQIFYKIGR